MKVLRLAAWLLLEYGISTGLSVAVSLWAMRHWGPGVTGEVFQAASFVSLVSVVAMLGLDLAILRRLSAGGAPADILGAALGLRRVGSLIAAGISLTAFSHMGGSDYFLLLILFATSQVIVACNVYPLHFMATGKLKKLAIIRSVSLTVFSLLRISVIYANGSILVFQSILLAEGLVGLALMRHLYKKDNMPALAVSYNNALARDMLKESWPVALSGFLVMLFLKIDVVIISKLRPAADLGLYAAALRVQDTYLAGLVIVLNQAYVLLAKLEIGSERYDAALSKLFRLGTLLAVLVWLFQYTVGSYLLHAILGPKYYDAVALAAVLCLSLPILVSGTIRSHAFALEGLNRYHPFNAGLGIVLLVPLLYWATLNYGLIGSVWALLAGIAMSGIASSFMFTRTRHLGWLQLMAGNQVRRKSVITT